MNSLIYFDREIDFKPQIIFPFNTIPLTQIKNVNLWEKDKKSLNKKLKKSNQIIF